MHQLLAFFSKRTLVRMRRRLRRERFFGGAVDHGDLEQRMTRWEHAASQVRAPW